MTEQAAKPKPWHRFWRGSKPKGLDARYHKVTHVEKNGEYVCVQFVREDGEIVVGAYKLIGWSWAPADIAADFMKALSGPPVVVARGRKAHTGGGDA